MSNKPILIALHAVLARCPQCKRKYIECDYVRQRRNKHGKPIRHEIECDLCMEMRVGTEAYKEYVRLKDQIRRVHPDIEEKARKLEREQ